jgi:ABC-type sugar transport system permease subunit
VNQTHTKTAGVNFIGGIVVVAVVDFFGLVLMGRLIADGLIPLASVIGAIVIFISLVFLRRRFSPFRWMAVGIAFVILFSVYPIVFTILLSFTNMGGGHLLTKQQSIDRLEGKVYVPEGAAEYSWVAYASDAGGYLLLLDPGDDFYLLVGANREARRVSLTQFGEVGSDGYPLEIDRHLLLSRRDTIPLIDQIGSLEYIGEDEIILVQSLRAAAESRPIYSYDPGTDTMTDTRTGTGYTPANGTFVSANGDELTPGFSVGVGLGNYRRFVGNAGYARPLGRIIIWNLSFSFFSVTLSFVLGLTIALVFDRLPGRRVIRTLLLVPYPIPILVAITVWKGLLNEQMGLYTKFIGLFTEAPSFLTDRNWTRIALIVINIYLSYPYFYILCAGAIRSIPGEIFQAAAIDGAGGAATIRHITMPMVLRILAPLLIASFSFNFNNFTLIWGFNAGLPAMADTIVPMGYTDLLISFVYRLGFGTANASNYGFASAITVLLFLFVGIMVFFQTRSTKAFKEDSL